MRKVVDKYMSDITQVFSIGVDVLNGARSLKGISLDLKLLAINGIVQAAKIGSNQGQSLITLSGFLSDLPIQIAPELDDLESTTSKFARQLTICSIAVRRFMHYSIALKKFLDRILKKNNSTYNSNDFNLLDVRMLSKLHTHHAFANLDPIDRDNLKFLASKNMEIVEVINDFLYDAHNSMTRASKKLDSIKRNGFIANYMGSNILIESSYLSSDQKSFSGLVNNIKGIVKILDEQLQMITENISKGDNIVTTLIKVRTT